MVLFVTENSDIHAIGMVAVVFAGGVYSSAPDHSASREIQELLRVLKPKILVSNVEIGTQKVSQSVRENAFNANFRGFPFKPLKKCFAEKLRTSLKWSKPLWTRQ